MAEVLVERAQRVVTLTLNRPERLNAVTATLYQELIAALQDAAADPGVRAVVLTGQGRAFCVGADLVDHAAGAPDEAGRQRYAALGQDAAAAILGLDKPVIGALNGHAIGAGLELALACDLTVVADAAKLRFPELTLGTFVGGGTTVTLVERAGMTRAKELLLLGRFFSAAEAVGWGLCNEQRPAGEVLARATLMAAEVAARSPRSVAFTKRLLRTARDRTWSEVLAAEAEALARCMGTKDWQEGLDAYRDRREPRFTGE
ncbi:MAG: enoyl-CoA hydratase/isomerase family protein [Planctomycetes bacterium]|nr:enoyl-CoA hydratase/isomerase family protein [Planctomycetota bacterium]